MRHALVTGGSGYLGSHVCKLLKNNGWNVSILDIKFPRHNYVDNFFQTDIRDKDALKEIFYHHQYDVVFQRRRQSGLSPLFLPYVTPKANLPGSGLTFSLSRSFL